MVEALRAKEDRDSRFGKDMGCRNAWGRKGEIPRDVIGAGTPAGQGRKA
ncbi:MAG: hypothetical protein GXX82_11930 [Syntrophorhabdus sp.]|nr:hypothetical protein [Syntrophorhabdus sp.]